MTNANYALPRDTREVPIQFTDSTGNLFSNTNPMPVAISGSFGNGAVNVSITGPNPLSVFDSTVNTTLTGLGVPVPVPMTGSTGTDGSTTLTLGGTAQNLFSGVTPTNGFSVTNPDPTEDLWISLSTTALANGTGSLRVPPNGGTYTSPFTMKPFHAVSVVAATTSHKITAYSW